MTSSEMLTLPCLQRYAMLSAKVFSSTSDSSTEAALELLVQYLQTQSCSISEVEAVRQWCQRQERSGTLTSGSKVDFDALQQHVAVRASEVRAALDQSRERTVAAIGAASAQGAAERAAATAHEASRGLTASLVPYWELGAGDPWSFATGAATSPETPGSTSDAYVFLCLKESMGLVEPYLNQMRCAAALGQSDLAHTAYLEGSGYLVGVCGKGDPGSIFASLELARTLITVLFSDRGGVGGLAKLLKGMRVYEDLQRVAALLEKFDSKEGDAQDTQQQQPISADAASGTLPKAQAYWTLAVSYSVFFHTVAAYVEGATGSFDAFASAVLGTGGRPDAHLWGASRFPAIPFVIGNSGSGADTHASRPAAAQSQQKDVRTTLAAIFPSSTSFVSGSAADYHLAEYRPLVTHVIAPAASFCTLLILSAVAALPLPVAVRQLSLWSELRELYEDSAELEALLAALQHGRLGAVWTSANAAATRYLGNSTHVQPSALQKLLYDVKRALSFHYLRTREVTDVALAARELGFHSSETFMEMASDLIRDLYVAGHIDLVEGTVHVPSESVVAGDDANMKEAVARAVLGHAALEMQLTCVSAERNLVFVPVSDNE